MQPKIYDVAVVGLGTAGSVAFIRCAELNLSVIGIERLNQMGGTGTAGGISHYYYGSRGGRYEAINSLARDISDAVYKTEVPSCNAKALAFDQICAEKKLSVLYRATVVRILTEQSRVKGIEYMQNGETHTIHARFIIDATANGEIAKMCGAAYILGRQFDNRTQPYTNSCFIFDHSTARVENYDAGYIDLSDPLSASRELLRANAQQLDHTDFANTLQTKIHLTSAPLIGIREDAHIVGEETVTLQDALNRTERKHPVFFAYSNIDHHGKDIAFEPPLLKDYMLCAGLWGLNLSCAIPMEALIPKNLDGILVAGRALSTDHMLSPCVRMKSDMEKSGEAAACMVYLAIRHGCKAKDIPYGALKELLEATGCLDHRHDVGFQRRTKTSAEAVKFPETKEEMLHTLRGSMPGFAIWRAKSAPDATLSYLKEHLAEGGTTAENIALALGIAKQLSSLPILRKMAKERSLRIPHTSIKYVQTVGVSAVYLLGRLADKESVPILQDIIADNGRFNLSAYQSCELYSLPEDLSFQLVCNAAVALCDIAQVHPDTAESIHAFLNRTIIQNPHFQLQCTLKGCQTPHDHTRKLKDYIAQSMTAVTHKKERSAKHKPHQG